jgi:hypothetical protein
MSLVRSLSRMYAYRASALPSLGSQYKTPQFKYLSTQRVSCFNAMHFQFWIDSFAYAEILLFYYMTG